MFRVDCGGGGGAAECLNVYTDIKLPAPFTKAKITPVKNQPFHLQEPQRLLNLTCIKSIF